MPCTHPSSAHAQIQKWSRCSCLHFWWVRNLVAEIPEKSEPNLLLKEGKMRNYYVFCQTRKKHLCHGRLKPWSHQMWHFESSFRKSWPWWSTAWQDLCWKVQGQPWPCDSWPSGSWCDTTFGPFVKYIVEQMTPARLVTQGLYVHSLTAWLWLLKICDSFNRQVSYHYFAIPQVPMHSTYWWWMPDRWSSVASLHLLPSTLLEDYT